MLGLEDFGKGHVCLVPTCVAFHARFFPLNYHADIRTYRIRAAFASQTLTQGTLRS